MARCGFDGAIDAIYQAAAEPALWPAALEQIADHVGGLGAILVHNDIAHRKGFIVSGRLRDDLGELYLREYCDNPLVAAIAKYGRPGRPDLVSTFAGNIAVKRTAFHADILEPQAIVDQIAMPHQALTGNGNSGGFSVMLSSRHVDDASAAVNRMMRLAPHLSRALDLSLDVAEHRNVAGRLATLLDALPTAAVLLDCTSRIIRTNKSADIMLSTDDGIGLGARMRLKATLPDHDGRLRKAIANAITCGTGKMDGRFEQSLSVQRPSGLPPLLVVLTPLVHAPYGLFESAEGGPGLLVQVIDAVAKLDLCVVSLRKGFGLTAAEARIAGLIGSGLTAPQAAKAIGLSANTVRTHLAHIFDKTGVRSQAGPVRLLGAIGPTIPSN